MDALQGLAHADFYGFSMSSAAGTWTGQLLSGLFVFLLAYWIVKKLLRYQRRPKWFTWRRAKKMKQRARGEYIKQLTGDLITDAFEEAEYRGLWTRREKNTVYDRIGRCANYPDLIPKRLNVHPAAMKAHLGKLKETLLARRGIKDRKIKFPDAANVVPIKKEKTTATVRSALAQLATKK